MIASTSPLSAPRTPRRWRRPGSVVAMSVAYLAAAAGVMMWRGVSVSPDYIFFLLIPIALVSGRTLGFLGDWIPFIVILLAWEAMRGLAVKVGATPEYSDSANVELAIFGGHLPTSVLQQAVDVGVLGRVLPYLTTIVYFSHFVFALGVGVVLWLVDRTQFLRFSTALVGMSLVAFVVFLVEPSAPPWLAEQQGLIGGFQRVIGTTLPSSLSPLYSSMNPNPVAAFPSLHAAFPFLCFLATRRSHPRAAWLILAWCAVVFFSVVYMGEHYVIDVAGGVVLATAAWTVMMRVVVPRAASLQVPLPVTAAA